MVVCDVFPAVMPFLLLDCGTLKRYPQAEVEINCPTYRVPIPFSTAQNGTTYVVCVLIGSFE